MSNLTETRFNFRTASITGTAAALVTFKNLEAFKNHLVSIAGLTTETIGLKLSGDGGATVSAAIKPVDVTTLAAAASAALGNGYYIINSPTTSITVLKSAGVESATVQLLSN